MTARCAPGPVTRADEPCGAAPRRARAAAGDGAGKDAEDGRGMRADIVLHARASDSSVRALLQDLRAGLAGRGVPEQLRGTVEQAVAEALNNIVEHAYGGVPGGAIALEARIGVRGLWCTLRDRGAPLPGHAPPAGRPPRLDTTPEALPEGGFGWFLIRSLAQEVDYAREAGTNRLTLGFDLPAPAPR